MSSSDQAFPISNNLEEISIRQPEGQVTVYSLYVFDYAVTSLDTTITYKFN
jgi:hypothetical protein